MGVYLKTYNINSNSCRNGILYDLNLHSFCKALGVSFFGKLFIKLGFVFGGLSIVSRVCTVGLGLAVRTWFL